MDNIDDSLIALRNEGYSFQQIGDRLGITKDAAQKRYRRLVNAGPERGSLVPVSAAGPVVPPPLARPDRPSNLGGYVGFDIVFADLETTDLKGNFGRLLAGCGVDSFGNLTTFRKDRYKGRSAIDDSRLAVAIRDYIERFDMVVTWNGKLFDVPFLNARLRIAGERPLRNNIMHLDLMYFARGQFLRVGSSRLDNVAKVFHCENQKTPLVAETWALATAGDITALDSIVEHCEADVLVLRDVFRHLKSFVSVVHR